MRRAMANEMQPLSTLDVCYARCVICQRRMLHMTGIDSVENEGSFPCTKCVWGWKWIPSKTPFECDRDANAIKIVTSHSHGQDAIHGLEQKKDAQKNHLKNRRNQISRPHSTFGIRDEWKINRWPVGQAGQPTDRQTDVCKRFQRKIKNKIQLHFWCETDKRCPAMVVIAVMLFLSPKQFHLIVRHREVYSALRAAAINMTCAIDETDNHFRVWQKCALCGQRATLDLMNFSFSAKKKKKYERNKLIHSPTMATIQRHQMPNKITN